MALKETNKRHVRTPSILLDTEGFATIFDATIFGSAHRLLTAKICRSTSASLPFRNEEGYLTQLARRYDKGRLCTFMTDAELSKKLCVSPRYVYTIREKLVKAKLVKVEKFKDGYIYELGSILSYNGADGYSVGKIHEGYYIDEWYSMCEDDPLEFRLYLFNLFGDPSKKYVRDLIDQVKREIAERDRLIKKKENSSSTAKVAISMSGFCKIFQGSLKNISEKSPNSTVVSSRAGQPQTEVTRTPIEAILTDKQIKDAPSQDAHKPVELFGSTPQDRVARQTLEAELAVSEFEGVMRSRRVLTGGELFAHIRELKALGVPQSKISSIILSKVDESQRFTQFPVFSYLLSTEQKGTPKAKVAALLVALRMECAGLDNPDGNFAAANKVARDIVDSWKYDQIVWTMTQIARTQRLRDALVKSIFAIKPILTDKAADWKALTLERQNDAIVEGQKKIDKDEKARQDAEFAARFNEQIATTIKPAVVEEDTVESLQAQIAAAESPLVRKVLLTKLNRLKAAAKKE